MIDTTGKTLWQLVVERAELDARQADGASTTPGRTLTFGEYRDWCERAAAGFAAHRASAEGSVVSWVLPSRFESLVRRRRRWPASAPCRTRSCRSTATARSASSPARAGATLLVVPRHVPRLRLRGDGRRGDRRAAVDVWSSTTELPEGDPATLPAVPARHSRTCAGSSTRRARPPTRRAPSTATARCRRPTTACSGAWRSPATTGPPSCSRSPTSAGWCGCSTRCRPASSC